MRWTLLSRVENPRERFQVSRVAGHFAQEPVFGTPKQIGIDRRSWIRPRQGFVVVLDDVDWSAAEHHSSAWARRAGYRLPGLSLAFGDHQTFAVPVDSSDKAFCQRPLQW